VSYRIFLIFGLLLYIGHLQSVPAQTQTPAWTFVSSPDWFNRDDADLSGSTLGVPKAEGWDLGVSQGVNGISPQMAATYDLLVGEISTFNPQFFIVAGDLINGRWSTSATLDMFDADTRNRVTAINNAADIYFGWYRQLFGRFGISTILAAVGDHEIGDDPWPVASEKALHVQTMKQAFGRNMVDTLGLPTQINGADSRPYGTPYEYGSYAYQHQNLLVLSIDVIRQVDANTIINPITETASADIDSAHLAWIASVLGAADQDPTIDHVIVQGHTPILGPVRMQSSSGMMLVDRDGSDLWQLLRLHSHGHGGKVRFYFSGEVHAVTASKDPASEIVQLVHGNPPWAHSGLLVERGNYVVFTVHPDRIEAESHDIVLNNDGSSVFWEPDNPLSTGPSSLVTTNSVGQLVVNNSSAETTYTSSGDLALTDQVGLTHHYGFDAFAPSGNFSNLGSIGDDYYEGIAHGGASITTGKFGSAIQLNGSSSFVSSGRGNILDGESRSVSAWVNTVASSTSSVVSYGGNKSGANGRFNLLLVNGRPRLNIASGITCKPVQSTQANDGVWHHIAATLPNDHTNNCADVLYYVDGIEVGADFDNANEPLDTVAFNNIRIGVNTNANNFFFNGAIDDVAMWGSALPASRLRALVTAGNHITLSFNAVVMESLFDLFDAGQGEMEVGGFIWATTTGLIGNGGDITDTGGGFAIQLDELGNGILGSLNRPPSFTSSGPDAATEDAPYSYTMIATDDDGDTPVFAATTLPSWLSFDGANTVSGIPQQADVGVHDVTVTVTDNIIASPIEQNIQITVENTNDAPTFASTGTTTAAEGSLYSYTMTATDDDGDALVFSAVSLPNWLNLTGGDTISGTPQQADIGVHDVTLAVTDNIIGTPTEQSFQITVDELTGGNIDPTAAFTTMTYANSRLADFDAADSNDPGGTIASYMWDFGDGSSGDGLTTSHTWAANGTFTVTLTVTDDQGAIGTTSQAVSVSITTSSPLKLASTVKAVGARSQNSSRLNDELSDNSQDLTTSWNNDGNNSTAWFTLDLGSEQLVNELKLGPRADRAWTMDVFIGNTLVNGQVSGSLITTCTSIKGTALQPTDLQSCSIPVTSGRYITVKLASGNWLKFYGIEVWGGNSGGGNVNPTAEFTPTTIPLSLQANFDASNSNDLDGTIVSYVWKFGDGNFGSGISISHTWAVDGTYPVQLTVTDDEGAIGLSSQNISVSTTVIVSRKLPVTVATVGAKPQNAGRLNDEISDNSQNLLTSWNNDGNNATAWFTMDLGSSQRVEELKLAPRSDRAYVMEIYIGSVLLNGQVIGPLIVTCTSTKGSTQLPSILENCLVPETYGRYVTVKRVDGAWFKFFGIEVWGG
jgi:hypothetical protein